MLNPHHRAGSLLPLDDNDDDRDKKVKPVSLTSSVTVEETDATNGVYSINQYLIVSSLSGDGTSSLVVDTVMNECCFMKEIFRDSSTSSSSSLIHQRNISSSNSAPVERRMQFRRVSTALFQSGYHPNLVTAHEIINDPKSPSVYIISSYIVGGPMFEANSLQKDGTLKLLSSSSAPTAVSPPPRTSVPLRKVARFGRQLCSALSFLHDDHKAAHCNIKPHNVLVDEHTNTVFLAGLVSASDLNVIERAFCGQSDPSLLPSPRQEEQQELNERDTGGRRDYDAAFTPPEVLRNDKLPDASCSLSLSAFMSNDEPDAAKKFYTQIEQRRQREDEMLFQGDIWSLGVTLYVMVYGKIPFITITKSSDDDDDDDTSNNNNTGGSDSDSSLLLNVILSRETEVLFPSQTPDDVTVPESLKETLRWMIEKDPAKRITAKEAKRIFSRLDSESAEWFDMSHFS